MEKQTKQNLPSPEVIQSLRDELLELERKEVALMTDMDNYQKKNKLFFLRDFNPPQKKLWKGWNDDKLEVFTLTGGNRLGKTVMGAAMGISTVIGYFPWLKDKDNDYLVSNFSNGSGTNGKPMSWLQDGKRPRKVRWVGQGWEQHIKGVLIPALNEWWPECEEVTKKKNSLGVEILWTHKATGSTIEIVSNEQKTATLEGWHGDLVIYDEPPKREVRVACARGLVDREGRELLTMTLLNEAWIHREIIKARNPITKKLNKNICNVTGEMADNIGFGITQKGLDSFASKCSKDDYEARVKGVPAFLSGLIYKDFDPDVHVVPRFQVPLDWPISIAIDVHLREPQAILFMATAPGGKKYLVNEIFQNGNGTWIGEQVARCVMQMNYRVSDVIIDPFSKSDYNSGETVFEKVDAVLHQYELYLEVGSKDKVSGILEVRNHLIQPNGEPSLYVFDDLFVTIEEFEGYAYDKETSKPVDKDDHMMENLYRLLLLNTKWHDITDVQQAKNNTYVDGNNINYNNQRTGVTGSGGY